MIGDDRSREQVLTAWGEQERPRVLAYTRQQGEYWLVRHDEYLSRQQGSYRSMIVTPYGGAQSLRGWRGLLVVVIADGQPPPQHWEEVLTMVSTTPGVSTWTEVLP